MSPSNAPPWTTASSSYRWIPEIDRYELDDDATERLRAKIRVSREGWLAEDPESVAVRYRSGELSVLDLVRRYGVIVDWGGTGELLPTTTAQFRDLLLTRSVAHWS